MGNGGENGVDEHARRELGIFEGRCDRLAESDNIATTVLKIRVGAGGVRQHCNGNSTAADAVSGSFAAPGSSLLCRSGPTQVKQMHYSGCYKWWNRVN